MHDTRRNPSHATAIGHWQQGITASLSMALGLALAACGGGTPADTPAAAPVTGPVLAIDPVPAALPPQAVPPAPAPPVSAPVVIAAPLWPAAPIPSSRPPTAGLGKLRAGASSADASNRLDLSIVTATLQQNVTLVGTLDQRWAWVPFRAVTQAFGSPLASTLNGRAALVFLRDGRLWRIRPEGYDSTAPRQLSTTRNACQIAAVRPLNAAGNDAWIALRVAGPEGSCLSQGSASWVWTRLEATAQDEPVAAPAAAFETIDWLEDEYGSVRGLVIASASTGTLDVLRPQGLERIGTVTGVPAFREARPLAALKRSLASWWVIDGRLHKLDWSGGRPALTVALPAGITPVEGSPSHVIGNELFVQSGRDWLAVADDGRVRTLVQLGEGEQVLSVERQDGVLLLTSAAPVAGSAGATLAVWAVPLNGGTARRFGDEPGQRLGYVGALDGEALFVRSWARTGSASTAPFFDRLEAHRLSDGRVRVLEDTVDGFVPNGQVPTGESSLPLATLIYRVPLTAGVRGGAGRLKLLRSTLTTAQDLMATPPQTQLTRWIEDSADAETVHFNLASTRSPAAVDLYEVLLNINPPVRRLTQYLGP